MFPVFAVINNVPMNAPLDTLCTSDTSLFGGCISVTGIAEFLDSKGMCSFHIVKIPFLYFASDIIY